MDKVRVGVIGCGAIAQIQYLPLLREMKDQFEIAAISDLSSNLLNAIGKEYEVDEAGQFLDYHDLVECDLDIVVVCSSGSHAPPSIAASKAGKHVLVEKPMCTTVSEAKAMVAAAEESGTILMVAYMKRYDPGYIYACERIEEMDDIRFVQINHLHPDNSLHIARFKVKRFNDIPAETLSRVAKDESELIAEALGFEDSEHIPRNIRRAFSSVRGSMIHDIGNLAGAFGPPSRVLSTEIWSEGRAISTTLEYEDQKRAVCSWVDLPELWDFRETMEVYGSGERVIISFPTGFSTGLPSTVTLQGMESSYTPWRKELVWYEDPFKLELQHIRECVLKGKRPSTDGRDAVNDVCLVTDIVRTYLNR